MPDKRHVEMDLTDYKDRQGDRIPPGRYRVRVEDAEVDQSNAGNPMINTWLRVSEGEFEGAVLVDRLVITPKSMWRPVNFMRAIGLPTPRKRLRVDTRQFVNRTLDVDVDDGDPYNGRVKTEVRGYMRILDAVPAATQEEFDPLEVFSPDTDDEGKPKQPDTAPGDDREVDLDDLELG